MVLIKLASMLLGLLPTALSAEVISFENLPEQFMFLGDGQNIGSFYAGVDFGPNVTGLNLAGSAAFPPHSGSIVIWDPTDITLSISFAQPQAAVGVWYTSFDDLTLSAFDKNDSFLGSIVAVPNTDGTTGTSDFISITRTDIRQLTLEGSPGNFVLDDLTLTPVTVTTPEPIGCHIIVISVLLAAYLRRLRVRRADVPNNQTWNRLRVSSCREQARFRCRSDEANGDKKHVLSVLFLLLSSTTLNGGQIYVATTSTSIAVIQTDTNIVSTIPVPEQPEIVALSADGAFLYTNNLDSALIIRLADSNVTTVPLSFKPPFVAVTPNGKLLWAPSPGGVSVIDLSTNTVVRSIATGQIPIGIAFTQDSSKAYVANSNSANVSIIDVASLTVIGTIAVGNTPTNIVLSPDGKFGYVANINGFAPQGSVSVIDVVRDSVVATIPVGNRPLGIAFAPDGSLAYVANGSTNDISIIDTSTFTVTASISGLVPHGSPDYDRWLAISTDGSRLYVPNEFSSNVSVIDTATRSIIATVNTGGHPAGITGMVVPSSSIIVSTTVPSASFSIAGPPSYHGTGVSFVQTNVPLGMYTITFGAVLGYLTPPTQTRILAANQSIVFSGDYQTIPANANTAHMGAPSSRNQSPFSMEPVNTATGNYYISHTDLAVPARGMSFAFARVYNSADTYNGPLGPGWTHSFNVLLVQNTDGSVSIKEADGGIVGFAQSAGGYEPSTPGDFDTLAKNKDGSFTLTRKNQTHLNFSSQGRLTSIIDRNGNAQTLGYDNLGNLASITDSSSRIYVLGYDSNSRLSTLTDPIARTLRYTYDALGRVISFTDPTGGVTQYAYDSGNRMLSATDSRGNIYLQNAYDPQGRVVAQKNARNFTTTFAYDTPIAGTTSINDPLGNLKKQTVDSLGRFIQEIDAAGGVASFEYDSNNLRTSVTDPLGRVQGSTYDARGNPLSITDPTGKTSFFTFDISNNLLTIKDRLGRTTALTYDSKGNLLRALDPDGNSSSFTYDTFGQVLTAENARNFTTSFQYDAAGNLIEATDALEGRVNMAYDAAGRLTSIQNQLGKSAKRSYDADNRLLSVTDPLGNITKFAYDANGNLATITDANGKATQYAYDPTNKLGQVTDALGGLTRYQYDGNTDLTAVVDAKGHTTTYAYDSLRRLTSTVDPLGRQNRYSYDSVGNVTGTLDGNNKINAFAYDALNRLVSMALSDGKNVSYTYDAVGQRLTMTDWRGTAFYAYDLLNRVTSIATPDGNTVGYGYDPVGNRATLTYPDGRTAHYAYDALNRLSSVSDWSGKTTMYDYDAASNLTGFMHPNGASSSYQYDAANQLLNLTNRAPAGVLSGFAYTLDKVGNRIQMTTNLGGVNQYGYDALYRLTSWTAPSNQVTQWDYDAVGNRLSMASSAGTTNYTYDAADQLLGAGTTTYTYDGNGNQLTKTTGATTINNGWDALNRLISVVGGPINTHYQYAGDGNRVSQQVPMGTYTYTNDTAAALPDVLNENGPDGAIDYLSGLFLLAASSAGFQYYYQFDGVGSAINITDSNGIQKANYSYDPWGRLTLPLDPLGTKEKYKFTGEAVDPNAGLLFLRARYYDATSGQFLSPDPLPHSRVAPYGYARGSPLQYTDPSGLSFDTFLKGYSQVVGSIPDFIGCSISGFQANGTCTKFGFDQEARAAGQALDPIGFVTGPATVAYGVIPKIVNGSLSNTEAALTVLDLATSIPGLKYLKYLPDLQFVISPIMESSEAGSFQIGQPSK